MFEKMRLSIVSARASAALFLLLLALTGCAADSVQETVAQLPLRSQPQLGGTANTQSPASIYAALAPSIAHIATVNGTGVGSGILLELEDGKQYILSNAHVVWPHDAVRVVFPDGTELAETPVKGVDAMVDLALLGPVEVDLPPAPTADGTELPIGSELYLVGYPVEAESFPQPTISRGILSRIRTWPAMEVVYLQTDADIAGGQSGGALVNGNGEIVGVSGWSLNGFALAESLDSIWPRIEGMAAGEDVDELGNTRLALPSTDSIDPVRFELFGNLDTAAAVFHESYTSELWAEAKSWGDLRLRLYTRSGDLIAETDLDDETVETVNSTLYGEGVYFLVVDQFYDEASVVEINSSNPFTVHTDIDDYVDIAVGEEVLGYMDYPGDWDSYLLEMEAGETIAVGIESMRVAPYLVVQPLDESIYLDTGLAVNNFPLWGDDTLAIYRAPQDGLYGLAVVSTGDEERLDSYMGGYILRVNEAPPDATPLPIPTAEPTAQENEEPADSDDETE